MSTAFILVFLTMLLPLLSYLGSLSRVPRLDNAISLSNVAIALFLYEFIPLSGTFYVDFTTWVFILMVTSIHLLSQVYSKSYFRKQEIWIGENLFNLLLALFTTSMLFSLEINNIGLMWVGIEATTISSALLLMTEKTETSAEATWRYIVIVSAGVTFAFFSIILIYYSTGTLELSSVLAMKVVPSLTLNVAVAIALIGFGTKVGVFPVHTWLPDAHSEAPSPISAMFSGVLLPTALYVLYRIYEIDPMRNLFVWAAVVSVIAASLFLGYQTRYKRMFAYSTMENMNLALIGLAIGGEYGLFGALLLLLSHSFGKAGAFYSSGSILRYTGAKKIEEIQGLWKAMPVTSSALLMSSFAVTGTPPFGTFFGEFLIFYSLFSIHYYAQLILLLFFVMAAFISVNYNVTRMVFHGEGEKKGEEDSVMSGLALLSSAIPLLIGVIYVVMSIVAL